MARLSSSIRTADVGSTVWKASGRCGAEKGLDPGISIPTRRLATDDASWPMRSSTSVARLSSSIRATDVGSTVWKVSDRCGAQSGLDPGTSMPMGRPATDGAS